MQQGGRCPNCGSPVNYGQRFCGVCGALQSSGCAYCGSPLEPNARFCPNCGSQAGGAPQQQAGWGQQPQQPGWGQQQQAWGQPQQPGWGQPQQPQQPGWGPPGAPPQSGPSRGLLLMLLLILLIALGGFIYWQFGSRMGNILSFLKTSGGGGGGGILDNTAPTFSNIKTSPSAATSVVVTWTTSEPASSQVEYGTSTSYGSVVPATPMFDPTTGQSAGVVTHSVELTGLQNSTTYHFRVKSKDKAKNEGISADNTFTVQAPPEE